MVIIYLIIFLLVAVVVVAIGATVLVIILQWRANKVIQQQGGRKLIHEINSELQGKEYSLVSLSNKVGKPEVWIFPQDVGEQWESKIHLRNASPNRASSLKHTITLFRETWSNEYGLILEPDDELFVAIADMSQALDLVEKKIGYPAVRKIDFACINIDWEEID
ncbi:hypothetical protein Pan241w_20610 [Gimesia alba]|uniref:Uncharacterized protein n=1 Tax=Gimesia alba TaxID=2527973 RepID=A0A517RDN0_9PLAN|nr:hypothetical protein [Gimesia alba]QDT41981.1 hypothetical protein Pan241w_20610 [Gimesia alba]